LEGPGYAIAQWEPDPERASRLLTSLSIEAIKDHPVRFGLRQMQDLVKFILWRSARPEGVLNKEHTFLEGAEMFGRMTMPYPSMRRYVTFSPDQQTSYVARMAARPAYPYEPGPFPLSIVWPFVWLVGIVPILAVFFTALLLQREDLRYPVLTLWTVIVCHILLCNLGGGRGPGRYAIPVEPFYVVLAVAGFSEGLERFRKHRPRRNHLVEGVAF
jgi:hypothetical protein